MDFINVNNWLEDYPKRAVWKPGDEQEIGKELCFAVGLGINKSLMMHSGQKIILENAIRQGVNRMVAEKQGVDQIDFVAVLSIAGAVNTFQS